MSPRVFVPEAGEGRGRDGDGERGGAEGGDSSQRRPRPRCAVFSVGVGRGWPAAGERSRRIKGSIWRRVSRRRRLISRRPIAALTPPGDPPGDPPPPPPGDADRIGRGWGRSQTNRRRAEGGRPICPQGSGVRPTDGGGALTGRGEVDED